MQVVIDELTDELIIDGRWQMADAACKSCRNCEKKWRGR